jgi:DNA-directed RNA polymerase specialized sigma24 family protein
MPDLHEALVKLRRATSQIQINETLTDVLQQATRLIAPALRVRLTRVQSLVGPHRAVDDVEDVVQVIAMQIWRDRSRYRGRTRAEAEAWVRKIAEHRAGDTAKTPLRRHKLIWKEMGELFCRERKATRSTTRKDQEFLADGTCE